MTNRYVANAVKICQKDLFHMCGTPFIKRIQNILAQDIRVWSVSQRRTERDEN